MRALSLFAAILFASGAAASEPIKIGIQKLEGQAPIYIAEEKGYFRDQGLDAEIVFFDAAQPIAVGIVSGGLDFAVAGFGAGFYNLAGQGELRIIAAYIREAPSFQATAYVISNRAYDAGFTTLKDFAGKTVAVMQVGASQHYALGLLTDKYGIDLKGIRVVAVQLGANEASAVVGGQVDAAVVPETYVKDALAAGNAKLIGFVGDETPWQLGAAFTATRTADDKRDRVMRFLAAYKKGVAEYHDAFIGPDERRLDGPTSPDVLAIVAKYMGETPEKAHQAIAYYDREARLDVKDVLHQIAWYKAQGLVKGEVDGATLIDRRYVVPLPGQ
ncbi:MAG TPA: ABC transporter substrate-binding protein [Stellaceae bacterium]|nr:ABC transporter substrate-binding protein [Stellaceae bacterium]